ncbi:MAG: hypothetical protein ACK4TD_12420 [Ectopseudomonas guguanensis]|uniref:hypothetical protein n=1 Tax=Ectopseudomonas guguanensis TaxID=1198456 RepID=UPI00391A5EC4
MSAQELPVSPTPSPTWLTADMVDAGLRTQSSAAAQGSSPAAALSCAFKAMLKAGEATTEGPWPTISGNDLLVWNSLWLAQPSMLPPFVIGGLFQRLKQLLEEVGMLRQSHDEQLVLRATAYRYIEAMEARMERAGALLSDACTGDLDPTAVDVWMSEPEPASAELVFGRAATEAQAERLRLQETLKGHELWSAGSSIAVQQLIFGAISHLGKAVGDQPESIDADQKPSREELVQSMAFALYAVDVLDASSAPTPLDHVALEALLTSLKREYTDAVTIPRHRLDALLLNGQQREVEVYERVRQMAAYYEAPEGFHNWIDQMQNLARERLDPAGK